MLPSVSPAQASYYSFVKVKVEMNLLQPSTALVWTLDSPTASGENALDFPKENQFIFTLDSQVKKKMWNFYHILLSLFIQSAFWRASFQAKERRTLHYFAAAALAVFAHYSKSQFFVQKFNFDNTPTFSCLMFWQFFSWNQSCQQLKSPKTQHFHEFFTKFFFGNFSREMKVVNS